MPDHDDPDRETASLLEEIDHMKQALTSHAIIDQAVGVVIAYGGVTPKVGVEIVKEISQHTNCKLREVAAHLVQWPQCTWLPQEIRTALDSALENRKSAPHSMVQARGDGQAAP